MISPEVGNLGGQNNQVPESQTSVGWREVLMGGLLIVALIAITLLAISDASSHSHSSQLSSALRSERGKLAAADNQIGDLQTQLANEESLVPG